MERATVIWLQPRCYHLWLGQRHWDTGERAKNSKGYGLRRLRRSPDPEMFQVWVISFGHAHHRPGMDGSGILPCLVGKLGGVGRFSNRMPSVDGICGVWLGREVVLSACEGRRSIGGISGGAGWYQGGSFTNIKSLPPKEKWGWLLSGQIRNT